VKAKRKRLNEAYRWSMPCSGTIFVVPSLAWCQLWAGLNREKESMALGLSPTIP